MRFVGKVSELIKLLKLAAEREHEHFSTRQKDMEQEIV